MSIESEILDWALTRPAWQQQVLVSLADGTSYNDKQISELADQVSAGNDDEPSLDAKKLALKSDEPQTVSLISVGKLQGVNALIDDGELTFAPYGLTVIFGANGSGKSGYARLIKSLVGARHTSDVLPDVFLADPPSPSAELAVTVGADRLVQQFPGQPGPDVRKVSFYDEYCGDTYLSKQSTITYRPSALSVLDGLVAVCDAVRNELQQRADQSDATAFQLQIDTSTVAGSFYTNVTAATTDELIDQASTLPADANEQRGTLLKEEARLKATDPTREQLLLRSRASDIRSLSRHITALQSGIGETAQKSIESENLSAVTLREAARLAVTENTNETDLADVGAAAWRAMWEAARTYSTENAYPGHEFPHVGNAAQCPLCQQVLDPDASDRMKRFERYMADTTEKDAQAAEFKFSTSLTALRSLAAVTAKSSAALVVLTDLNPKLAASVQQILTSFEQQQTKLVDSLGGEGERPAPLPPVEILKNLDEMATGLELQADETDVVSFKTKLDVATKARAESDSSALLAKNAGSIKAEVKRLRYVKQLQVARSKADTKGITQKASQLARSHATSLILDQFTRETDRLKLTKVTLQDLGGSKGQLNQKPALLGAKHRNATAASVLSEGEQTALGLAGFFTEAEFDTSKSALVLDDPVTSLDHVRRENVALRLAELASDRQVIVFSHEIAFIGDLVKAAEAKGVSLAPRAIERVGKSQPGFVRNELPWRAKEFGARKSELEVELGRITKERFTLNESEYEKRVSAWAGNLSETWERCVSSEVVNKLFNIGASEVRPLAFRLLAKITPEDDEDFQAGYGAASKWARRHDNAPAINYVPPEPEEMKVEFDRLVAWQKRLKSYM